MTRSGPPTRRLILATAGVALLSRVARAQLEKRHRIAILAPGSRALGENWEAFRQGLRTLGYVDRDIESRAAGPTESQNGCRTSPPNWCHSPRKSSLSGQPQRHWPPGRRPRRFRSSSRR